MPPDLPVQSGLDLPHDEITVWHVDLESSAALIPELTPLLSPDELVRAGRFAFDHDRDRFIVARGLLRTILGRYLKMPPTDVAFRYTPFGKPALDPQISPVPVRFNVAHSAGRAVLAFAAGRELGVDLEQIRPDVDLLSMARQFFSPAEQAELAGIPPELRAHAFFDCWTRKEAFVKADGRGLSLPLDSFDVSLSPAEPAVLRAVRGRMSRSDWHLTTLDVPQGFAGALVASGTPFTVRRLQWPSS